MRKTSFYPFPTPTQKGMDLSGFLYPKLNKSATKWVAFIMIKLNLEINVASILEIFYIIINS
jgi:hypothetical protein